MADVKWIKITTDIFDDEKILLIESLPDAYAIIVVWFKLLCLAGKQNNSGVFLMNDKIPYTDKMLSTIFRMKESTVSLALKTFEEFGMIERVENVITIPNWGKHQNLEKIEARKAYQREYHRNYRKKQKLLAELEEPDNKGLRKHLRNDDVNALEEDIDKELEIDKENIYTPPDKPDDDLSICMNPPVCDPDTEQEEEKPKKKKPVKHKYGEYNNVLLTDEELDKLKTKFPDWENRIENLSIYIESKGTRYKSHYATILSWARREYQEGNKSEGRADLGRYGGNLRTGTAEELANFYNMAHDWALEREV